ncbi:MAG TPA: sugar phosphate isomerase/epimerase [Methylomirabilota bacterium]|nr:sugar phosphate isomerase/epimerase [Methylomirabilota bacterium]
MAFRLALHTWTLDTTPLAEALTAIKRTGWDAVELRRVDWERAAAPEPSPQSVEALVRASGLAVACVGVELGWVWAAGAERARLLRVFAEQCARAKALGCTTVMSAVNRGRGDAGAAARSVREVGDIAREHGVRLAVEFNSVAEQLNALGPMREVIARAGHPSVGLLLDTYHLGRTGASPREIDDLRPEEIAYVQYSDVPRTGLVPGQALDRLPPGQGGAPIKEFFAAIAAKGYAGFASYEAPNPAAWKRPAAEVAREALAATRAVQP